MWSAEYMIMQLYRSSSSVECAICREIILHRPQTRSSNMGTSDFWHTCTPERKICVPCMKKALKVDDRCPLCRKKIQSRVTILAIQDGYEFDRYYDETFDEDGFFYKIPSNWEFFMTDHPIPSEDSDDEETQYEYLGLKGPANTVKDLKQFLKNFMIKYKLKTLKIRIDGIDETLKIRIDEKLLSRKKQRRK